MKYELYIIILTSLFHQLPYIQLSLMNGNLPTLHLNLPFPHLVILNSSILINLPLSSFSPLNLGIVHQSVQYYRILSIVHSSIYSSNCPSYISDSLVQRAPLQSLRNHTSHLLSTPILRPSKINYRALSYDDDDDVIKFISTKIGSCRPLRSCGKKIILK